MPPRLDLRIGCARWLRRSHVVVSLLGLLGILTAVAPAAWTAAAVITLAAVHAGTARRMKRPASDGRLELFADGTALLCADGEPLAVVQTDRCWVSRWFCLLSLKPCDGGRLLHVVVCRSLNAPDTYRRLLQRLRLGAADAAGRGSRLA